jgi:2-polyprenyl-6-methoxyphenol hydroxylase-like FAD-dependent oxidoreductase
VNTQILISGGSIAGPALAHWLHRFGFRVTIVERSPGLRPGGQAVDIRGIAKEVVRRMGLDAAVRAACTDTDGISVVTRNNRRVATMRSDLFDGDGLIAEIEILRGDLSEVFYEATKDNTEYLFGDRIESLSEDADGVSVRFASGLERRFDLVIGADGLHSGVRSLVFGPESDYIRHLGHYLSFFTVPNRLGLDRWALGYGEPVAPPASAASTRTARRWVSSASAPSSSPTTIGTSMRSGPWCARGLPVPRGRSRGC